jgi:hypothetical protein
MSPVANTLYSVSLFLALVSLKLWLDRRHRISMAFRAGVDQALGSSR